MIELDTVKVYELDHYTDEVAAGIGQLMHQLDPAFSGGPTPRKRLERIIESPYHAQIVAVRKTVEVVGALTMSMIFEPGFDQHAFLGGVVTRSDMRGMGIGRMLMAEMFDWAREHEVTEVEFSTQQSKPTQPLGFYLHMGAVVKEDSTVLAFKVPK